MGLFLALLAIAPLSVLVAGGAKVRLGLIVTVLVTGTCMTLLELWFEAGDPDDVATLLLFSYVVLPVVSGVVAGIAATVAVGTRRAFGLPIAAGVVGAFVAILLGAITSTAELWWSIWAVTPVVVLGSSFAVTASALGDRRAS